MSEHRSRVPTAPQKNQGSPVAVPSGLANALVIIADSSAPGARDAWKSR